MPVRIRAARPTDLAEAGRLGARLAALHHEWDPARFFALPDAERGYRRYLASQLEDPQTVLLVADDEGRIVGYAYASLVPRDWSDLRDACGKLHDLIVDETARGRGVGRALLAETVARLAALGAPRVVLMVAAANEAAQAVFRAAGFRPTMVEMTVETGAAPRRRRRG